MSHSVLALVDDSAIITVDGDPFYLSAAVKDNARIGTVIKMPDELDYPGSSHAVASNLGSNLFQC